MSEDANDGMIMDIVAKKMPDAITKGVIAIFGLMLFFLTTAAATATEPFLRKNLGERFLTPIQAFVSLSAWIALWVASFYSYPARTHYLLNFSGLVITFAYVIMVWKNLAAVRFRFHNDIRWHSQSKGESFFGSESLVRDLIVEASISGLLCWVSPFFGLFFLFSRLMSHWADYLAMIKFYNQYLDVIDAQIEGQHMESALREGFAVGQREGFHQALPFHAKGASRANIARVAASNYTATAPSPNPATTPEAKPSAAGVSPVAIAPAVNWRELGGKLLSLFWILLMSQRFRNLLLLLVAIVVVGTWGIPAWRSISKTTVRTYAEWTAPREVKPVSLPENLQPAAVKPDTPPAAVLSASNPEALLRGSNQTPQNLSTQPASSEISVAHATPLNPPKNQTDDIKELAALNTKLSDRVSIAAALGSLVESNAARLMDYEDKCNARYSNNVSKVLKITFSACSAIQKKNKDLYQRMLSSGLQQAGTIDQLRFDANKIQAGLEDDPKGLKERAIAKLKEMEAQRQAFLDEYDQLDADIAKAPKKKGWFN